MEMSEYRNIQRQKAKEMNLNCDDIEDTSLNIIQMLYERNPSFKRCDHDSLSELP